MHRRLLLVTLLVIPISALSGCGGDEQSEPAPSPLLVAAPGTPVIGSVPAGAPAEIGPVDPATASHPEVVQILITANDGTRWMCTGALVSKSVAVTAGHCLQPKFVAWTVVAPTLKAKPRVKATAASMYDARWAEITSPDLGMLRLEVPIELPQYAELTDVTARVDGGEALEVATIVRTKELVEAPFMKTRNLAVSSTVDLGYPHGYGVPLYSHGGDSGAGMFLVENGTMTHKLVGVEREPDPAQGLDHLSRVDAAFIAWVAAGLPDATPVPPDDGTGTTTPTPTAPTAPAPEPPGRKKK